jgi:hypothetical protein
MCKWRNTMVGNVTMLFTIRLHEPLSVYLFGLVEVFLFFINPRDF